MESLKKSCLRWGLFYVVIALLVSAVVYMRFPSPGKALAIGFIAGFFLMMAIAYPIGILMRRGEANLVRRGIAGGRPNDGEKIAVFGNISSSVESLEAPISKRRCVAYEYKGYATTYSSQSGSSKHTAYEGFQLIPVTIEGPRGSIRLLAAPDLAFPEETQSRLEVYQNFRDYIAQTQFSKRGVGNIKAAIAELKNLLTDDDGRIRYDYVNVTSLDGADEDVANLQLTEKILASGEPVCAIGRYSAARNGLVPDPKAIMHPVKLVKGGPDEVLRTVTHGGCRDTFLSLGCLIPVIAGAIIGLAILPLDAIEQLFPKKDASWQEIQLERWVKREVRPRLPESMKEKGEYSIMLERGQARGKLTSGGATTQLTRARAARAGDSIEVTLTPGDAATSGVVLLLRGDRSVESLRVINGLPLTAADVEIENLAIDEYSVIGRVIYLSPEHKLRAAFNARFERGAPQ